MVSFPNFFSNDSDNDKQESKAQSYLDEASSAQEDGHSKLAIHLYIAAFEQEALDGGTPSDAVLGGMLRAWDLACSISDKSSAETLFTDLAPYSSPDQTAERVRKLQEMAVTQLEEMGVPSDRIEKMSIIHTPDATAAGADPNFINKFHDMMQSINRKDDIEQDGAEDQHEGKDDGPVFPQWGRGHDDGAFSPVSYDNLIGYQSELKKMCVYGFESAGDEEYKQFVQETSEFHGLQGLSLYDPFMFYGPSRDDVYEFAEATAGEIGNPLLALHVRTDDEGMWTIRLTGPFHKGLFGVSDPTDIPTPCTFIIENIDILQDFIKAAVKQEMQYPEQSQQMPNRGTQMYGEILGYIHAILQKPDVFPIITAQSDITLSPQFEELFSRAQRIKVDYPTVEERKEVWKHFASGHNSFANVDIDELSRLSEGISRHDMVVAGRNAVRDAYQESLTNNDYKFVNTRDVLFEMVPFVSQKESTSYNAIEDAAAEAFVDELSEFSFEDAPISGDDAPAASAPDAPLDGEPIAGAGAGAEPGAEGSEGTTLSGEGDSAADATGIDDDAAGDGHAE